MGVFPEKECALAQVDISEYRSRVAIRKWATLSVCPKCSISVAIFFMGSTAHFISPLKLGDSVSFETSSNVLSRWKRRARGFAPCSVDSTANFSLCRGINAQDRLQFSPALVNVIVPAIGSISEIEKPCIRRRYILAMAGSLSLSSVVCRAGHALPLSKICLQIHGVLYPASVVTACTFGECSIRHLKNASNAALSWMLPGVTSASIRVCRKWYAPRTTFRRRCPAPDVLTTTRRWKTSWAP